MSNLWKPLAAMVVLALFSPILAGCGTPAEPVAGATQFWEKDGSTMVYVPAGEFTMGSSDADIDAILAEHSGWEREWFDHEYPQHTVYLNAFWIDQTEVSNEQYGRCVAAGACQVSALADDARFNGTDQPAVGVSWHDAEAYCEWAGKRLPTEAEWEKAARGTDGGKYPWGGEFDCQQGDFDDETEIGPYLVTGGEGCDGYVRTAPVGSFPAGASPYGVLDMAGNVWEWCQDRYDKNYYVDSPQHNPQGPDSGEGRVIRGGSWDSYERFVRSANRGELAPDSRDDGIGFRCVAHVPLTATPLLPTATPTPVPSTPAPAEPVASATRVWKQDGSVMVYVPAGEFSMGSSDADIDAILAACSDCEREWYDDEHPQHTVYVSAFWMDQTKVTNRQYGRCVAAGACQVSALADDARFNGTDQPVVGVSWDDAKAYCEWADKQLPTEAQWEKAARGTDGRTYPWGDTFDGKKLNYLGTDDGYEYTSPVGSYPAGASPHGALDMAGNVWEWCQDWYDAGYYAKSPQRDPQGPDSGVYRVVRGGSWRGDGVLMRAANRDRIDPVDRDNYFGFRCVSPAP